MVPGSTINLIDDPTDFMLCLVPRAGGRPSPASRSEVGLQLHRAAFRLGVRRALGHSRFRGRAGEDHGRAGPTNEWSQAMFPVMGS